ncbi:MAG: FadR/GntR family transcriptional regulator [Thermodesulfobacteriota bacterium]
MADQIKQTIFDGKLQPGDKLPAERELCEMFIVGRPTIREALRALSIMGLIEVNTGERGSIVKKCDITQYMEAMREQFSWLIKVEKKTIKDLWEVRKYIELGIAHSAAANATKGDLKKLDQIVKRMESCSHDIHAYFPIAVEFHKELSLITKNKIFYIVWGLFQDILLKGYVLILSEIFPERPSKLLESNKILLKAIKSKDADAINKAMEIHATNHCHYSPRNTHITAPSIKKQVYPFRFRLSRFQSQKMFI